MKKVKSCAYGSKVLSGPNFTSFIFGISQARVFLTEEHLQHAYGSKPFKVEHLMVPISAGSLLTLPTNARLGCMYSPEANTLKL